jgi:hypothetical protein
MHRSRGGRVRVVALCAMVAMGLVACGDDDDDEAADTTTETTAAGAAPQASGSVTVDMSEYAFAVSGPLTAGGTIKLANRGREFHVAAMGKLKPGKTLADLQTALSQSGPEGGGGETTTTVGGATTTTARRGATTTSSTAAGGAGGGEGAGDPTEEVLDLLGPPGGFMSPNESVEVNVPNLGAGTYAFVCFIPSEGDGVPHFAKGMISQMEVIEGTPPPAPTADATYKVAPGRAVEGPASLSAGRHTLKIEAAAGSDQLEPGLARLNPGTTFTQLDTALSALFESEAPPAPGTASRVPGQVVYAALDLGSTTTFYVTVDLRAGNYALVAEDTDPENRQRPPRELINITVG